METEGHARAGIGGVPKDAGLANHCAQKGNLTGSGPVSSTLDACPGCRRNLCVESGSGAVSERERGREGCEGEGWCLLLRAASIECRHSRSPARHSPRLPQIHGLACCLGSLHCPLRSRLSTGGTVYLHMYVPPQIETFIARRLRHCAQASQRGGPVNARCLAGWAACPNLGPHRVAETESWTSGWDGCTAGSWKKWKKM